MTDWNSIWKEYEHQVETVYIESKKLKKIDENIQKLRSLCDHDWNFLNGLKVCKLCRMREIDKFDEN